MMRATADVNDEVELHQPQDHLREDAPNVRSSTRSGPTLRALVQLSVGEALPREALNHSGPCATTITIKPSLPPFAFRHHSSLMA